MNIKKFMSSCTLAAIVLMSLNASAANVDVNAARAAASKFMKQQNAPASFKAHSAADLRLAHAEASSAGNQVNAYYVFNIDGGGFVIIAGEDRAEQVLGYSDNSNFDPNNVPYSMQGLLQIYKEEIEFLQNYKGDDLVPAPKSLKAATGDVEPLIKTNWGQEMPYYLQCPKSGGEYCVVGCVATAMAQVMKYWQYPQECNAISSYYCYDISQTVAALPATTFNYNLMLNSYCHWDWDNSQLIQDTYTDAQAQEVAKLSRYCGQAVEMGYSPEGSGAYTWNQLYAMEDFGYRSSAELVSKGGGWWGGSDTYSTEEWEEMLLTELQAGRPVLYSASDVAGGGGHAFICDGYRSSDGMFHFNMGWYGTCDGWYKSTALNMTHRDGDYLRFNTGQDIIINLLPPEGWSPYTIGDVNMDGEVNIDDVTALIDYLLNGDATNINLDAADVNADTEVNIADVTALVDKLLTTKQ